MMLISGQHKILFLTLKKLRLGEERRLKNKTVNLFDFGARIQIIVSPTNGKKQIELRVTFHEDYEIHNEAMDYLRLLYGAALGFTRCDDEQKVIISIRANEALVHFDSPRDCAINLSQIRVQAAGAPILNALNNIDSGRQCRDSGADKIYKLGSYGKCGTYHCICTDEKVIVVFVVSFEEEMERCLARLFLQQFEVTQQKIPLTPHCKFCGPNQATKELKAIIDTGMKSEQSQVMPPTVGFLSFTFFSSSASSKARNLVAVDLLVNFLPYMDRHVKSTKSLMLNEMRSKMYDILPSMQDPVNLLS